MKKYLPFVSLFLALFLLLLLGDGLGSHVDVAGAAVVLAATAIVSWRRKPVRRFPKLLMISWSALLVYLLVILPFSVDVGISIRTLARYIDAFLVYWVFYVFTPPGEEKIFVKVLSAFGFIVLGFTVLFGLIPIARAHLPFMNLFWSYDGHNHISDLLLLVFLPALTIISRPSWLRYVVVAAFLALFVVFQARIALVAAAVAAAVFIAATHGRKLNTRSILVAVCVFVVSIGAAMLIPKLQSSITRPTKSSLNARLEYWHQAALAIRERPLFGFGPGTFLLLSPRFQSLPNTTSWYAHSYALETAAESGVIGLGLFWLVLYVSCVQPIVTMWTKNPTHVERAALGASVMLLLLYGLTDFSLNFFVIWVLFWATSGMVSYEK